MSGLKLVKLSYLVYSTDWNNICFHMTCLLSTYWRLLPPELFIFTNHAVKQKKLLLISKFLSPPSPLCYNSSTRFPELVRPLFLTSGLFFVLSLWPLNWIFWHRQFLTIYNGSDSFPYFLKFLNIFCMCWTKHLVY